MRPLLILAVTTWMLGCTSGGKEDGGGNDVDGVSGPADEGAGGRDTGSPDPDDDDDGVDDGDDNCPLVQNSDQANLDTDSLGDICDEDDDGDSHDDAKTSRSAGDPLVP